MVLMLCPSRLHTTQDTLERCNLEDTRQPKFDGISVNKEW